MAQLCNSKSMLRWYEFSMSCVFRLSSTACRFCGILKKIPMIEPPVMRFIAVISTHPTMSPKKSFWCDIMNPRFPLGFNKSSCRGESQLRGDTFPTIFGDSVSRHSPWSSGRYTHRRLRRRDWHQRSERWIDGRKLQIFGRWKFKSSVM